ncbi:MAG TPA: RNA 3'-terminal phosphate cyclase [Spirochaetota bacterium]|nr:RNA 3'-terminal phosphate cyclase [Spirochaetota bacterium]HRZ26325.1 RNA 3'-terminal phosphate cyclase [Spirochaetota bacterium]HSA14493.1 RNA 3'-terminal phosphate cyclase [Spirochaetota bacterium]
MAALAVSPERPDWVALRQCLAVSLACLKPVVITGGAGFLENNPKYTPVYEDIRTACLALGAGSLDISGGDILFEPAAPRTGTFFLETGPFSSAVEVLLFLLPALFKNDFRTVVNFRGVTHSPHSYPTAFIKETLLPTLEKSGLYASLTLGRFGFYGSGGGMMEARAYPAEQKACDAGALFSGARSVEGVRVFIARASVDLARREVETIREGLGLPEGKVSILEIRDADGFGNTALAYVRCGDDMMVLHRDMEMYDWRGDFIFEADMLASSISAFMRGVGDFLSGGPAPVSLTRELVPFRCACLPGLAYTGYDESLLRESLRLSDLISGS